MSRDCAIKCFEFYGHCQWPDSCKYGHAVTAPTEARPLAGARETQEWPELDRCVCGGGPMTIWDAEALFHVRCFDEDCGREAIGNSRAEAGAAWQAMQRAARGGARETGRSIGHLWAILDGGGEVVSVVFPQSAKSVHALAQRMGYRAVYVELVTAEAPVEKKSE